MAALSGLARETRQEPATHSPRPDFMIEIEAVAVVNS
jgi:hypothetical protein